MASCLESAASNVPFVEGQSCEDAAASAQPLADETVVRVLHPVSIAFPDRPRRAAIGSRRVQGAGARALPHGIDPAVAAVGEAYRIDPRLLHAVVSRESRFRPDAVSPKGALGLMQIMPATARDLGITDPTLLTRDPLLNLVTGARYLKLMQARFGNDLPKVLAAYNAGPGAVARHGGVPPYAETRGYVRAILGDYRHKLGQTSQ
jgi:soluble lytic murein transglycosylase-like protein